MARAKQSCRRPGGGCDGDPPPARRCRHNSARSLICALRPCILLGGDAAAVEAAAAAAAASTPLSVGGVGGTQARPRCCLFCCPAHRACFASPSISSPGGSRSGSGASRIPMSNRLPYLPHYQSRTQIPGAFSPARCHRRGMHRTTPLSAVDAACDPALIPSDEEPEQLQEADELFSLVPRLTLSEYRDQRQHFHDRPVLITDAFASPDDVDVAAGTLLEQLADVNVVLQRKVRNVVEEDDDVEEENDGNAEVNLDVTTELYDVTFQEAVSCAMASYHDDAVFAFCEGLLPTSSGGGDSERGVEGGAAGNNDDDAATDHDDDDGELAGLSRRLARLREKPFATTENWFDYFPPSARPSDAVILAGEGATSTFHRDPFEWTGTSLCLEGSKIWRFVLPPPPTPENKGGGVEGVDDALGSYRLDSIAWSCDEEEEEEEEGGGLEKKQPEQQLSLSAGWQSNLTLFESRSGLVPSAEELAEMAEENDEAYRSWLEGIGTDPDLLSPSPDAASALETIRSIHRRQRQQDGDEDDESVPSDNDDAMRHVVVTAVQRAGDLLLIPAHCWHQTYAPEPSVAVASQRCGAEVDGGNMLRHVLETVGTLDGGEQRDGDGDDDDCKGVPETLTRETYREGDGKEVVGALFEYLSTKVK